MNSPHTTRNMPQLGAVDKVANMGGILEELPGKRDKKKDALRRHFIQRIIHFRFKTVAERRQ